MVEIYEPKDLSEALEILSFTDCTIFAGGTDLMVKKKQRPGLAPCFDKPVLFISQLWELRNIAEEEDSLVIGAACTLSQLIESPLLPDYFKTVFLQMASPGIRNMATVGGNLCNASPAGDCLPLLYALDAAIEVQSSCRKLQVPIHEFILGPGKTMIKSGELVTAIRIPESSFNIHVYRKIGTRRSTALSKLSFIGFAASDEKGVKDVRIAFGAVAPTVVRSRDVEEEILEMLKNGSLDMSGILSDYGIFIKPIGDQRSTAYYRKEACRRLLVDFMLNSFAKEDVK